MDVTPVGVGVPYDVTAVTLLAVYWATLKPQAGAPEYILAMILAVPWGYVFQALDKQARRLNTLVVHGLQGVPMNIWGRAFVEYRGGSHLVVVALHPLFVGTMWAGEKLFFWVANSPR